MTPRGRHSERFRAQAIVPSSALRVRVRNVGAASAFDRRELRAEKCSPASGTVQAYLVFAAHGVHPFRRLDVLDRAAPTKRRRATTARFHASSLAMPCPSPHTARRCHVVEIGSCDDLVTVRVACEGDHTGTFFELLSPTHRRVCFDVAHRLALEGALLREDRIVLDVRRIISQLVAPTPPPQSPTMPSRRFGSTLPTRGCGRRGPS